MCIGEYQDTSSSYKIVGYCHISVSCTPKCRVNFFALLVQLISDNFLKCKSLCKYSKCPSRWHHNTHFVRKNCICLHLRQKRVYIEFKVESNMQHFYNYLILVHKEVLVKHSVVIVIVYCIITIPSVNLP